MKNKGAWQFAFLFFIIFCTKDSISNERLSREDYDLKGKVNSVVVKECNNVLLVSGEKEIWCEDENHYTFDKKGLLIKHVRLLKNGGSQTFEYQYNKKGQVVKKSSSVAYSNGYKGTRIYTYTYDKKGNTINTLCVSDKGNFISEESFKYNDDDEIIIEIGNYPSNDYKKNDSIIIEKDKEHRTYTYYSIGSDKFYKQKRILLNSEGLTSEEVMIDYRGDTTNLLKYEYDEKNRVTKTFYSNPYSKGIEVRKYDENDRVVQKIVEDLNSKEKSVSNIEYTSEGLVSKEEELNGNGKIVASEEYSYNEHGVMTQHLFLVKKEEYNFDEKIDYIYDKEGNWIEKTIHFSSGETGNVKRTISYH